MSTSTRTAFLISGGGSTMQAVIQAILDKNLSGIIPAVVISSTPEAAGLEKAKKLGVPTAVIDKKNFDTSETFGQALLMTIQGFGATLISQNGWLPLTPKNLILSFENRIINQHLGPLDPGRGNDFGGKGMYGLRVMAARCIYEWIAEPESPWTEATVHFVNDKFDEGDLIKTKKVDLPKSKQKISIESINNTNVQQYIHDSVIEFQKQFLPVEHQTVIEALQLFANGDTPKGFRREKPLVLDKNVTMLEKAKSLAIELFPHG